MKVNVRIALLVLPLFLLTGCLSDAPYVKKVGSYATLTAPDLDKVSTAYASINDIHTLEEQAQLVASYNAKGFVPGTLAPFLTDASLKSRTAAIGALKTYATALGTLANGKTPVKPPAPAAPKTATPAAAVKGDMTVQQMNQLLTGLDALLQPYLKHELHHRLPPLIKAADPIVQQISTLLVADMDTLRTQAAADYQTLMIQQDQFIAANKGNMSAIELRAEVLKLSQIDLDAQKVDSDLAVARNAAKQLGEAHHRLVTTTVKRITPLAGLAATGTVPVAIGGDPTCNGQPYSTSYPCGIGGEPIGSPGPVDIRGATK